MKESPILFNSAMVQAILSGQKTQTRRFANLTDAGYLKKVSGHWCWHPSDPEAIMACPYGQPGDHLWVRETWSICQKYDYLLISEMDHRHKSDLIYAADGLSKTKKRPSIHMPRWASRISLEITRVRIERLRDISEADALAEGVERNNAGAYNVKGTPRVFHTAVGAYDDLFTRINGPGSWAKNPLVWVVEFKKLDIPNATPKQP